MQELLKNSFILSVAEILLKVAKLISFIIIANIYSVEYLGLFNYIVSFLLIFSVVGELGINTYITTEQSRLETFPDKYILAIALLKIVSVFVVFIIAFLIYLMIENNNYIIFILLTILIFSDSILSLVYSFYRAVDRFKYEFYFKTLQAFIYFFISFGVYYWGDGLDFIYFIAFITLFNILLAVYSLYKLTNFKFDLKNSLIYIKRNIKKHFIYILPIFLSTIFTTIYFRIDILMLENMIGVESVGYYSIAYKLIEGAMVLPLMLGVVFLSKLSNKRKNIKQDLILHFVLGFIIFIGFYFTVFYIIDIFFADNYIVSVKIAQILSYSIIIMSLNTYMFNYFIANKRAYINVKITLLMLVLNLILNYIYIPLYGIGAAAYTTIATEFLGMILLLFYIRGIDVKKKFNT